MRNNYFLFLTTFIISFSLKTQTTLQLSNTQKSKLVLFGFGDLYFGKHIGGYKNKEDFYYNHKVNNKLRTNLLLIKGEFSSSRFHATLGLMTGDYSKYNLASEPTWAKPLNEAFVGYKVLKNHNLWWDVGVYSSFIGIESSISSDCPTLTRSIVAENSPYFFSGTRLMFASQNSKNELGFHVLNGWQRIYWDSGIKKPSFGAHYKRRINDNTSFMYGLFYGSIYSDSLSIKRFYQHANINWKKKKLETWGTLDFGIESGFVWGSAQIMANYTFNPHWSVSQRLEIYYDPNNRCALIDQTKETSIGGYSICTNYAINKNILFRFEPKFLMATESILKDKDWDLQFNLGLGVKF